MNRFQAWLPDRVDRRLRVFGWLSLISQTLIVATGGLVRLTGSGLGCPTWPRCTADSFVATPEMGIHGAIEFGNRLMTFVLVAIALATFILLWRLRKQRRDLFWLAFALGAGIPMQGVIGGITVLTSLNPYVVGLHFVLSVVLVCLATVLVHRMYVGGGPSRPVVPGWVAVCSWTTAFFVAVTIISGIVTTGSGPHAGDQGAARNGLDSELLQHVHSWPAYVTLGLTLLLIMTVHRVGTESLRRRVWLLLAVEVAQIIVGVTQSRLGLPEFLVGAHMVLACLLAAAMTGVMLAVRQPTGVNPAGLEGQQRVDADSHEQQRQVADRPVKDTHR